MIVELAAASRTAPNGYAEELQKQAFLLASAGLGVCFAQLYRLSRDVAAATYDEGRNFQVFVAVILGLASGTILAQFIPLTSVGSLGSLTKPTLALIGGFSSSLVFRILTRLVDSVEALFAPDADTQKETAGREKEAQATETRAAVARELIRVQGQLPDPEVLNPLIIDLTTGSIG